MYSQDVFLIHGSGSNRDEATAQGIDDLARRRQPQITQILFWKARHYPKKGELCQRKYLDFQMHYILSIFPGNQWRKSQDLFPTLAPLNCDCYLAISGNCRS